MRVLFTAVAVLFFWRLCLVSTSVMDPSLPEAVGVGCQLAWAFSSVKILADNYQFLAHPSNPLLYMYGTTVYQVQAWIERKFFFFEGIHGLEDDEEQSHVSSYNIFGGRIEGELSEDVYILCNKLLEPNIVRGSSLDPSSSSCSDNDKRLIQEPTDLSDDDIRHENEFLKDWLSLVAADSKIAIDFPAISSPGAKQHDTSSFVYGSPVGSQHCEALFHEQIGSLDFSAVADEKVRLSLARDVVNELKKQHHNCLVQSAYIELQEEIHKKALQDQSGINTNQDLDKSCNATLPGHSTLLQQCYQNATDDCTQRLRSMALERDAALHDKEIDCKSRIALKAAGCKARLALKEMGCSFSIVMKEEECREKVAVKESEYQESLESNSWSDSWEQALFSMDGRLRNATTTTHNWIADKLKGFFGTD